MTVPRDRIAAVGAGRMGRGMAIAFAYGGHDVVLIDAKARSDAEFVALETSAISELRATLTMLAGFGMLTTDEIDSVLARITVVPLGDCAAPLAQSQVIFEGVPEVIDTKRDAFTLISAHA
ncbi:MAG: 3-hydroxybutyryl-CoA dehydrogenase, partial [Paracoccaceae bacterium]